VLVLDYSEAQSAPRQERRRLISSVEYGYKAQLSSMMVTSCPTLERLCLVGIAAQDFLTNVKSSLLSVLLPFAFYFLVTLNLYVASHAMFGIAAAACRKTA
jgi:hypothetical protein